MYSVRFVIVSVILEANRIPVASQMTTCCCGGGGGDMLGNSREGSWCGETRPTAQSSLFHFVTFQCPAQHPGEPRAQLLWVLHLHYGHTAETFDKTNSVISAFLLVGMAGACDVFF